MNFKPSDIFIGVIEFFSVMLPGALLTYFLSGLFWDDVFGSGKIFPEPTNEAAKWIVFLLITYILGNIIYMLASFLDATYDNFARKWLFQSKYDLSYKTAQVIQSKHIDTDNYLKELLAQNKITNARYKEILDNPRHEIFNVYKWSQHFLLFKNPDALADVKRTEADSKFFRSLVITFLIIAFLLFAYMKIVEGFIFIALSALCYYRYGDLRRKATEKAYKMIITCYHLQPYETIEEEEPPPEPELAPAPPPPTYSDLKRDLTEEFLNRHRQLISFLTKGFKYKLKLITVNRGERQNDIFITDKNDVWYCLHGNGILNVGTGSELVKTRLIPNAIIPIAKGRNFSFINDRKESIEILVLES